MFGQEVDLSMASLIFQANFLGIDPNTIVSKATLLATCRYTQLSASQYAAANDDGASAPTRRPI